MSGKVCLESRPPCGEPMVLRREVRAAGRRERLYGCDCGLAVIETLNLDEGLPLTEEFANGS